MIAVRVLTSLSVLSVTGLSIEESSAQRGAEDPTTAIRPYSENPWYWEHNGKPIVLIRVVE